MLACANSRMLRALPPLTSRPVSTSSGYALCQQGKAGQVSSHALPWAARGHSSRRRSYLEERASRLRRKQMMLGTQLCSMAQGQRDLGMPTKLRRCQRPDSSTDTFC